MITISINQFSVAASASTVFRAATLDRPGGCLLVTKGNGEEVFSGRLLAASFERN